MTGRWHRTKDLAGLPGMPKVARPIRQHGAGRGWRCREVGWGRRTVLEWEESSLPEITQAALRQARGEEKPAGAPPHPSADGPAGAQAGPSILACDTGPAAKLDARVELVTAFRRWHDERRGPRDKALREWCAIYKESGAEVSEEARESVPSVGWSTLRKWIWAQERSGSLALLAGKGGRTSGIDADPELRDFVEAMLRANPRHVTANNIIRAVAAKFPDRAPPSISCIRRFARRWRAEHAFELSAGEPDAHRSRTMPAFGSESDAIAALNALWELDSTRVDVMCRDGKRYALVAGIDVWSRRTKVLVTPQSRSTAIAALIRNCLLDWGVPDWIRTDEGADYVSKHLRRVIADLGIGHQVLPPYSPDKKPFIERFIGTLSRDFLTQLPGFTGHNVAQAQALRDRKSFAARRGEDRTATFRCELTAEELQGRIDAWCETIYGREPHAGLGGMSPFEKAASWAGPLKRVPSERGLDLLLAPAAGRDGRRKIGKNGIAVDGGLYIAGELGAHTGNWVHVRQDPADYGRIFVFTDIDDGPQEERGRFICIAEDPVRTGIDRQAVAREAKRNWRGRNSAARKRTRELEREHRPSEAIDAVLDRAGEDAAAVVAFPARGAVHSTGAMDEAAEAEKAAQAAARHRTAEVSGRAPTIFQKFYRET